MPYPRSFSFRRWKECSRCGLDYPLNELRRDSYGSNICPECVDVDGYDEERRKVTMRMEELEPETNPGDRL